MSQKELTQVGPGPGLYGSDREVFERVWRRVMPEVPVPTEGDQVGIDLSLPFALPLPGQRGLEEMPATAPSEPATLPPSLPEPSYPALAPVSNPEPELCCLGPSSAQHNHQLQDFIRQALYHSRSYQQLSRRGTGSSARSLATMATREKHHAKRLSTALFLISGLHYWPGLEKPSGREDAPFATLLRRFFMAEQRAECAYITAAETTEDPCLQELFWEIAQHKQQHIRLIRTVLEQL